MGAEGKVLNAWQPWIHLTRPSTCSCVEAGSVVLYMLSYCSMDKHTFPLLYGNGVTHDSWKCWESMSRSELRCLSSAII